MRIGIVGSGLAGLVCGNRLAAAGLSPVVFDKGRGPGGRLATRRAGDGVQFDHGAQYLAARETGFAEFLAAARAAGAVARWDFSPEETGYVGSPGMNGLAKHLARGLDLRQGTEVKSIVRQGKDWKLVLEQGAESFDCVICTAPAPQIRALLDKNDPVGTAIDQVRFAPCWTLMVAMPKRALPKFTVLRDPDDATAWIAHDGSKPGRGGADCWVAQANAAWSRQHIELDRTEIIRLMLPRLCAALGREPSEALHVAAHRWRYALVSQALGQPFASHPDGTLFAGGDWALGARAEAAWVSGTAIADAILGSHPAVPGA